MPLAFVRIAWVSIEADAPGIPETDEFLHYFNYHQHEDPRTNHRLEGWDNSLKRAASPNLYEFTEIANSERAGSDRGHNPTIKRRQATGQEKKGCSA